MVYVYLFYAFVSLISIVFFLIIAYAVFPFALYLQRKLPKIKNNVRKLKGR